MKKILIVVGTRPEVIKMIPVIKALSQTLTFDVKICSSGQHSDLLEPIWHSFGIRPDFNVTLERKLPGLNSLISELIQTLDAVLLKYNPDLVMVHGDTSTALAGALAAFQRQIRIAHVEAGLRTNDLKSPFPEEANRRIIDSISNIHFAPTQLNKSQLIKENIPLEHIYLTGNTSIDMLKMISEKNVTLNTLTLQRTDGFSTCVKREDTNILFTIHRRENFGDKLRSVMEAIKMISEKYSDVRIYLPVHPNPNVSAVIHEKLDRLKNIILLKPIDYEKFVILMSMSNMIYTDSGGIQEEAPTLGIPLLVMRDDTERPEGLDAGVAHIVGTDTDKILHSFEMQRRFSKYDNNLDAKYNPYGDGKSAMKIRDILLGFLN